MFKNVAGQKFIVFAYDTTTGDPKTGDAANITAQLSKDGGAAAATNDVNPSELDATNLKGLYSFDATQAESNADLIALSPVSSTADIRLEPLIIYTQPQINTSGGIVESNLKQINGDTSDASDLGLAVDNDSKLVKSNLTEVSGDATAADNLESILDGTGAALTLKSSAQAPLHIEATGGNFPGIKSLGDGSGDGVEATGGANGNGIKAEGGATTGEGIYAKGTAPGPSGNGIFAEGTNASGNGIKAEGGSKDIFVAEIDDIKTDTTAILVDTADMQPKLGTPAADISADIAAVKVDSAAILVDTADMQPKIGTPAADLSADIAAVNTGVNQKKFPNNAVYLASSGTAGTAYPAGEGGTPSNSASDALSIALTNKLHIIRVLDKAMTGNVAGLSIIGDGSKESAFDVTTSDIFSAYFENLHIFGTSKTGSDVENAKYRNCRFNAAGSIHFNGSDNNTYHNCAFDFVGTPGTEAGGSAPRFYGCNFRGMTLGQYSMGGGKVVVSDCEGLLTIDTSTGDLNGTMQIDGHDGDITITSLRAGDVISIVGGGGKLINNDPNSGTVTVNGGDWDISGTGTTTQTKPNDLGDILTDTADMQPKLGTPAADLSADIAAVKVDTAAILVDTTAGGAGPWTTGAGVSDWTAGERENIRQALGVDGTKTPGSVAGDLQNVLTDTADIQPKIGTPVTDLSADVASVKSDSSAILTDTADMQPKIGTPAADLSADVAAIKAETADILTDTADIQPKIGTPATDVSADIAAVKSDSAAILIDTADMQPKLGTPAADVSADIAAVKAETALIKTDTTNIETDTAEIGTAGAGLTDLGGMSTGMKAEVNAEVDGALDTAIPELSQGKPTATPTVRTAVMLPYMALRNKSTTTATEYGVHDDAGTKIAKQTLSDNGTTLDRAEMESGV